MAFPLREEPGQILPNRYYGFCVGLVTNNQDPEKLGRCKVHFPWLHPEGEESHWARPGFPMAGKGRGFWFIPELGDEVLCGFEHGDLRFPYILGSLYNGKDTPPSFEGSPSDFNEDGKNDVRGIRSRSGHKFWFHDGGSQMHFIDKKGNHLQLDTDSDSIFFEANTDVTIKAKGNNATFSALAGNIIINAGADIQGTAGADVKFSSKANTSIKAGANLSGTSGSLTSLSADATMSVSSGAAMTATSGATFGLNATGALSMSAGADLSANCGAKMTVGANGAMGVQAAGNIGMGGASASFGAGATMSLGAGGQARIGSMAQGVACGKGGMTAIAAGVMNIGGSITTKN